MKKLNMYEFDYIKKNLNKIKQRVKTAAIKYDKDAEDIKLIAVSKTFPSRDIKELYELGIRDFGENYIQEWDTKRKELPKDIIWHIIGNIQSNKTRLIANNASWVHTIDRIKVAEKLNNQRGVNLKPLNVCIQVNISQEPNKHGVLKKEVMDLAREIQNLPQLKLRGLMSVPSNSDSFIVSNQMQEMYHLFLDLKKNQFEVDILSMGMSHDLEIAIQNGSNCIRIGTALFGKREYGGIK